MPQIAYFEEFEHNGYVITTDLGSAYFHFEEEIVTLQGTAHGTETRQVEAILDPEDTPEFNNSVSASDGEVVGEDLNYTVELLDVEDVVTGDSL